MTAPRPAAETAVARALGLARQNAATAAVALGIVPLAAFAASPAHAISAAVSVTATPGGTPGNYTLSYRVTNPNASPLNRIEIPEINLGDIVFASNGSGSVGGASGWTATQVTSPTLGGAGLYSGSPAGYVELFNSSYGIGSGSSQTFLANVATNSTVNASFEVGFANAPKANIDPLIPNTGAAVTPIPEPSSIMALGTALLGLLAIRRRRT